MSGTCPDDEAACTGWEVSGACSASLSTLVSLESAEGSEDC